MTISRFIWVVSFSGIALLMAVAIVVLSALNERTQLDLQARQVALSSGVLSPQGQQIGNAVLRDAANAAMTNRQMHAMLLKYGYNIQPAAGTLEMPNE